MKKTLFTLMLFIAAGSILITSCKKKDDTDSQTPVVTAAKSFINVIFNPTNAFFSTDGSMSSPVDSNHAKIISSKIDITYFYNSDYDQPGFLDPKTRSHTYYWNDYYKPWLSNSIETRFYTTTFTKADFDAAKADQSKIGTYFSASTVVLAPHSVFPTGSCIGGRQSFSPTSILLSMGQVFMFKNTLSGKKGMMYITTDQSYGWPNSFVDFNTHVDLIREN